MAILIHRDTRIMVQGMTGKQGSFHTEQALNYGSQIVAGVTPGKGGRKHLGLPVFESVAEAKAASNATASMVLVPPEYAAKAIAEGIDAGLELIVCITERIPVLDMARIIHRLKNSATRLLGPNSLGIITPGQCMMGIMPGSIFKPGKIGIVSRASTLIYEAVSQTTAAGLGQTTCLGVGGDPIHGTGFVDTLELFIADDDTQGIIILGEIGGTEEEQAAEYLREHPTDKPILAYIAGLYAPRGRRMGHAGAIITGGKGDAKSKIAALEAVGVTTVASPTEIGRKMQAILDAPPVAPQSP